MFLNNEIGYKSRVLLGFLRECDVKIYANIRELPLHFTGRLCLTHLSEPVGLGPIYIKYS